MHFRKVFIVAMLFIGIVAFGQTLFAAPEQTKSTAWLEILRPLFMIAPSPDAVNKPSDFQPIDLEGTEPDWTEPSKSPFREIAQQTENAFRRIFLAQLPTPASISCPIAAVPTAIYGPFGGTHQDGIGGWFSENGNDLMQSPGVGIQAVVTGRICPDFPFGLSSTSCLGMRFYLCGNDGNVYFYQHLAFDTNILKPGMFFHQGEAITSAVIGNYSCQGPHLHISIEEEPFDGPLTTAFYNSLQDVCKRPGSGGDADPPLPYDDVPIPLPLPPGPPRTHSICEKTGPTNARCIVVQGPGLNQCRANEDCVQRHAACLDDKCIIVPEPGKDECDLLAKDENNGCPKNSYSECKTVNGARQCVKVPGRGLDRCDSNEDCN